MGLSSIQSLGKDLAETAVMAHWIAPDTYPLGNNLTILENLCPPRADSLLIGGLFAGAHTLLARAFHIRDKSEKMQFACTVFSGLTSVTMLSILPIQTDGFVEPYYDSVLKLVGIVAIKNIATDILKRCLDSREEVQPHKVYNFVAIGAVAGIAMHFYAFTGACYFSQMLFSDWMTGFGVLSLIFCVSLQALFFLLVDPSNYTLISSTLGSTLIPAGVMKLGFPSLSALIIASSIAAVIWETKIFADRQVPSTNPIDRGERATTIEVHT